jgi:D-amino-acid oxidase
MDRRAFLKAGGSTALGFALGGCVPGVASQRPTRRPILDLHPVEASWHRLIRTTVGHRPFRESGFLLRADRLDEKTVIHNYGHGGAGMSLSWGTGSLAADLAMPHADRRAAVIGCGIVGLTTARQLQRRGFEVTIYAADLPPNTTSDMSWAGFTPASGLVFRRTPGFDVQFRQAIEIAYREHQLLVGRGYGVSWIYSYGPTDSAFGGGGGGGGGGGATGGGGGGVGGGGGSGGGSGPAAGGGSGGASGGAASVSGSLEPLLPNTVEVGSVLLNPGEHPFPTRYARRAPTMMFEPSIYLEALMRDVLTFGGRIVVRSFDSARDLVALEERLIVNCTGMGAKKLFGDEELTPVKGQLLVLVPQPEVNYALGGMLPRRDGIVLGHMNVRGDASFDVDHEARVRVMENAMRVFGAMKAPRFSAPPVRLSMSSAPPVESFLGLQS